MIWYLTFQILATIFFLLLVYACYKLRKDKLDHLDDWLLDNWKKIGIFWVSIFIVMTVLMVKPLWKTTTCQFDGLSMNTETTYSWYKGQCLMKTKTGAWLPLKINRDSPEGDSANDI